MDSETGTPRGRLRRIDARLDAVRMRIEELGARDRDAAKNLATTRERREAAQRHAAEAQAAAVQALTSSAQAFRRAAEAHERVASLYRGTAAKGTGDVPEHERQAAFHLAAAAAARQRAEHAESLLSEPEPVRPAAVPDEPGGGVAP